MTIATHNFRQGRITNKSPCSSLNKGRGRQRGSGGERESRGRTWPCHLTLTYPCNQDESRGTCDLPLHSSHSSLLFSLLFPSISILIPFSKCSLFSVFLLQCLSPPYGIFNTMTMVNFIYYCMIYLTPLWAFQKLETHLTDTVI